MEKFETTRNDLIKEIFDHTANFGYNNETDDFDKLQHSLKELKNMSNTDLILTMIEYCSWQDEVEIIIND